MLLIFIHLKLKANANLKRLKFAFIIKQFHMTIIKEYASQELKDLNFPD